MGRKKRLSRFIVCMVIGSYQPTGRTHVFPAPRPPPLLPGCLSGAHTAPTVCQALDWAPPCGCLCAGAGSGQGGDTGVSPRGVLSLCGSPHLLSHAGPGQGQSQGVKAELRAWQPGQARPQGCECPKRPPDLRQPHLALQVGQAREPLPLSSLSEETWVSLGAWPCLGARPAVLGVQGFREPSVTCLLMASPPG